MKKRYIAIVLALCLLIVGILFGPKLYRVLRVWKLTEDFWSAGTMSLDVSADSESIGELEFRLDWRDIGEKRVYILCANGVSLYCCEGTVYLENGKGYAFGKAIDGVSEFLEDPWLLIPLAQIDHQGSIWAVMLESGQLLPELGAVTVNLEEENGTLERIRLLAWPEPKGGDIFSAYGRICQDRDTLEVPAAVLDAIEKGRVQGGGDLTEDMLRLMKGWVQFNARDPLTMELALSADCGVLSLSDTLSVYSTLVDGTPINYVEKPGFWGLYFNDRAVCTTEGTLLTGQESGVEAAQLLGLAYQLCFNGELQCEGDVFRLTLDQAGMEAVAYAIAPDARGLSIELTSGALELTMQGDTIERIRFECAGAIDLLLTQAEASIGAELTFPEPQTQFTVPEVVVDALTK